MQRNPAPSPNPTDSASPSGAGDAAAASRANLVDDAALAQAVDLASVQAAVLARHPSLVEAAHRVRALAAQARAEGSLPAPELMAELWQVPLARPYAVHDAGMLMFSVRQQIPAAGTLDFTARATALEARAAASMVASQARSLLREVDRAFADYAEASLRHAKHRDHLTLMQQMSDAARARYAAGAPLSDITKADVERVQVEQQIVQERGRLEEARASLNGLLARPVNAPLGPPRMREPETAALSLEDAVASALAKNPEIAAAGLMSEAAKSAQRAADREAKLPSFAVGLHFFSPIGDNPAGWGASFGMSIPWLWGRAQHRSEVAEQRMLAQGASLDNTRLRVRAGVAKAFATLQAAERRLILIEQSARPAARRALDAAQAGYAAGGTDLLSWIDAARMSLEVDMDAFTARAELLRALADLDAATGEHVPRRPLSSSTFSIHGAKP